MPNFTPEQLELIGRKRKLPQDRPQITSLTSGDPTTISADFEAFLILASAVGKANASLFINVILNNQPSASSRDQVLLDIFLDELTNATAVKSSMRQFLSAFESVKKSFNPGPFADVPEVQQFFDDLSTSFANFNGINERAQYELALTTMLSTRELLGLFETQSKANLRSYSHALNAYR